LRQTRQDEERRKIQFTGGSTYIISLPKKWIEINQLKKGSYIKLREEEGGLLTIVPPEAIVQEKSSTAVIRIISEEDTEGVIRKIISLYLGGYNSILIRAEKQLSIKQRHEIKAFVRRLLVGTEIVVDTSNQVMLQILLTYPELTILNTLRRMSIITKSMHNDAVLAIKTKDAQLANEVMLTDNEVDRFSLYVNRLLRSAIQNPRLAKEIGLINGKDCLGYIVVTRLIERTADRAATLAKSTLDYQNELQPESLEKIDSLSCLAVSMFEKSMETLFRQDFSTAQKNIERIKEVRALERQAMVYSQTNVEGSAHLRLIMENLRRTAEYASDISEIVLNLNTDSIVCCEKPC
jgi:phosphate uptake regulator